MIRLTVLALLPFLAIEAGAEPYRLQPSDQITLRALQWQADKGLYAPWDGLSGDYTISPEGELLLPLAGAIPTEGLTVRDLTELVSLQLQQTIGSATAPRVSIEIATYAPVYVTGAATTPGAYPYRPGLTVQQAVALSGGVLRPPAGALAGAPDRAAMIGGDIELTSRAIAQLQQEKARLEAELASLPPPGSTGEPPTIPEPTNLSPVDTQIFDSGQSARRAQSASLQALQATLREQIQRLEQQTTLRDDQIARISDDLAGMEKLKEQGLAANARVTALSTQLSDVEAKRLDLENARLLAEQQLNQAARDELSVGDQARAERLQKLREVDAELEANQIKLNTAQALYTSAIAAGATPVPGIEPLRPEYRLTPRGARDSRIVLETDPIEPGSTLEVVMTPVATASTSADPALRPLVTAPTASQPASSLGFGLAASTPTGAPPSASGLSPTASPNPDLSFPELPPGLTLGD